MLTFIEDLNRALRGVTRTQREIIEVSGEARTEDGLIRAVVGPRGQLVKLEIDPAAQRAVNLAETIVATVRAAAEQAMSRTQEILEQNLPDARGVFGDSVADGLDMIGLARSHDADLMSIDLGSDLGNVEEDRRGRQG